MYLPNDDNVVSVGLQRTNKNLVRLLLILNFRRVLYVLFWVIPWRLNFICRRFGTLFQKEGPETSAYKIQTPGNYPEENIHDCYSIPERTVKEKCHSWVHFIPIQ
jgi:hypothetical protein